MIVFHGCLFDATRIAEEGQIASRVYFEVVDPDGLSGATCSLDILQPEDRPYGEGEVRVERPEGEGCPEDRARLARLAAEYYRMVAADFRGDGSLVGGSGERARNVIVSRTWKASLGESS